MSILVNATVVDGPLNEFLCSFCRPIVESLAIFFPFFWKSKQTKTGVYFLKLPPAQERRNNDVTVMLLSIRESDDGRTDSDGLNKHFGK